MVVSVVLHRKRIEEVLLTGLMLKKGVKATVIHGHKTLVLYCHPSEFYFCLSPSKIKRKEHCRKERLERVLPKMRIDTFT